MVSGVESNSAKPAKRLGGATGAGFKPGQSGNPGGLPKGMHEVKEAARKLTPKAMKVLEDIATNEDQPAAARVAAAVALLDRGWGKPSASVDVTTQGQALVNSVDRPPKETREEWLERRRRELHTAALLGAPAGTAN